MRRARENLDGAICKQLLPQGKCNFRAIERSWSWCIICSYCFIISSLFTNERSQFLHGHFTVCKLSRSGGYIVPSTSATETRPGYCHVLYFARRFASEKLWLDLFQQSNGISWKAGGKMVAPQGENQKLSNKYIKDYHCLWGVHVTHTEMLCS